MLPFYCAADAHRPTRLLATPLGLQSPVLPPVSSPSTKFPHTCLLCSHPSRPVMPADGRLCLSVMQLLFADGIYSAYISPRPRQTTPETPFWLVHILAAPLLFSSSSPPLRTIALDRPGRHLCARAPLSTVSISRSCRAQARTRRPNGRHSHL
jgi:hypothetical protein